MLEIYVHIFMKDTQFIICIEYIFLFHNHYKAKINKKEEQSGDLVLNLQTRSQNEPIKMEDVRNTTNLILSTAQLTRKTIGYRSQKAFGSPRFNT